MNRVFFVENEETGALAHIPIEDREIEFFEEFRDVPVEEYVRRIEIPLNEVEEWNGRDHCIFGIWESIRQDNIWGIVYNQIIDSHPPESINIGIKHV